MKKRLGFLCLSFALAACGGGGGGSGSGSTGTNGGGDQPYGLDSRQAPSSVQIPTGAIGSGGSGSQDLRAVDAFPGLGVENVTVLTHAGDGSNRLFAAQRTGSIRVITNRSTTPQVSTFLDISSRVSQLNEAGLLGLAFDPAFASNGYFYVLYSTGGTNDLRARLSRFSVSAAGANSANATSERVLLEIPHGSGYHWGGWIGFGPDGMLYVSRGDNGQRNDVQNPAQLYGKMLRARVNNGSANAPTLDVPDDNPTFGSTPRNLVWAMGLRNPWRCSFDRGGNRDLWCGDVGESAREEVNLIRRAGNYGWPYYEGELPSPYIGDYSNVPPYSSFTPATHSYGRSVGGTVIGGYVYRGPSLSGMTGRYLYVDFGQPNLFAMTVGSSGNFVANATVASNVGANVQTLGEDQAGEVYAAAYAGTIYRFESASGAPAGAAMPATLSATGLFSNTPALTAAPGVIDYSVNAPFWSDGAAKRRWFVLPQGETIGFSADGSWTFPVGTITVKHFDLGSTKVETRVMVNSSEGWRGYSYRWRTDGQDADLVAEGGDSATYNGQTWNYPSRAQCLQCHTAPSRALGLNTRQFNGNHTYAATGRSDNQLRALNHIGIFSGDIGTASQYSAMPSPTDASASLEARARAYMDTNCSICHQPNAGTPVNMDLRYGTGLGDTNLVGVDAQAGGKRVAPGNPSGSDVVRRASSSDASVRMPPVGVTITDTEGVRLLSDWISALPQ